MNLSFYSCISVFVLGSNWNKAPILAKCTTLRHCYLQNMSSLLSQEAEDDQLSCVTEASQSRHPTATFPTSAADNMWPGN